MKARTRLRRRIGQCRECGQPDPTHVPDPILGICLADYAESLPAFVRNAALCLACFMDTTCTVCNDELFVALGGMPSRAEELSERYIAVDLDGEPRRCTVCGSRMGYR